MKQGAELIHPAFLFDARLPAHAVSKETALDGHREPILGGVAVESSPAKKTRTPLVAGFRFPTNRHRDEIHRFYQGSERQGYPFLRHFLLEGGSLGIDQGRMESFTNRDDFLEVYERNEYVRLINQKLQTWEGMTWILDLLPHHPATAVDAIEAYNLARPCGHVAARTVHTEAPSVLIAPFVTR